MTDPARNGPSGGDGPATGETVLVLNTGSSSLKYRLVDPHGGQALARGTIERIGENRSGVRHRFGGQTWESREPVPDHDAAIALMRRAFEATGVALAHARLRAVGHRIVHGGPDLVRPTRVDESVIEQIERVGVLAPLHNPPAVRGLRAAMQAFERVPHVAVFDTAFFSRLPAGSATYAIDMAVARRHALRRYGFHGTSHQYVSRVAGRYLTMMHGTGKPRLVVLHLGNGASASAIRHRQPLATSMGLTPMEGLVMGTRAGDLDPGLLLHLQRVAGMDVQALDDLLNDRSGLQGLAGMNDMRDVLVARSAGHADASLAFDVYVQRIVEYVGAYAALLGGVDALVFTAGVGENSPDVRAAVSHRLEGLLGTVLDPAANELPAASLEGGIDARTISASTARTQVLVVPTNEEYEIARQCLTVIDKGSEPERGPESGDGHGSIMAPTASSAPAAV